MTRFERNGRFVAVLLLAMAFGYLLDELSARVFAGCSLMMVLSDWFDERSA